MVLDFLISASCQLLQVVCQLFAVLDLVQRLVMPIHFSLSLFLESYVPLDVNASMQRHFIY